MFGLQQEGIQGKGLKADTWKAPGLCCISLSRIAHILLTKTPNKLKMWRAEDPAGTHYLLPEKMVGPAAPCGVTALVGTAGGC